MSSLFKKNLDVAKNERKFSRGCAFFFFFALWISKYYLCKLQELKVICTFNQLALLLDRHLIFIFILQSNQIGKGKVNRMLIRFELIHMNKRNDENYMNLVWNCFQLLRSNRPLQLFRAIRLVLNSRGL